MTAKMRALLIGVVTITLAWAAVFLSGCHRWTYQAPDWCITAQGVMVETTRGSCAGLQQAEDWAMAVTTDAGLSNAQLLKGIVLKVHPQSDGISFPPTPEQLNHGWTAIYADSAPACYGATEPRTVYLASFRWDGSLLCHEYAHIRRGCSPDDHLWMKQVQLDKRCTSPVQP